MPFLIPGEAVRTIYEGTPQGSAARGALVIAFLWSSGSAAITSVFDSVPKEFYLDLVLAMESFLQGCKRHECAFSSDGNR